MSLSNRLACLALSCALLAPAAAMADTYTMANFSGTISSSSGPFATFGPMSGGAFGGNLVFDDNLVPGAASGTVNVAYAGFPDIAQIPSSNAFHLDFGILGFELGDNFNTLVTPGIQYLDGQFNGFQFATEFDFVGDNYRLTINGADLTVRRLDADGDPTGGAVVNGMIAVGNRALTGATVFTPMMDTGNPDNEGVPEPATWALLILGFGGVGGAMRRRRAAGASAFA